mmetsp:Transcript_52812/g.60684  ORF Transcript_52812/g.60684 Transcript_52812/m.60684 type:complete len:209 (-) Transcript_52812:32-658(-)
MYRTSPLVLAAFHNAPSVYPFKKPFHDTPYDQDRHRLDVTRNHVKENPWPVWMDVGADGTGHGIGLHRTHPLSKLRGNMRRTPSNVPKIFDMMVHGVWHKSGRKLYFKGGKPPNPSTHPYLTGEPCPVYGWKVTDPNATRAFNVPHIEKDKQRYRPYVALQERRILGTSSEAVDVKDRGTATTGNVAKSATDSPVKSKPLMKRLFFWK